MHAAWKLLRALHDSIEFTTARATAQAEHLAEALELAAPQRYDQLTGSGEDRAGYLFWSAIAWGARAQKADLLTSVLEGLATRMHDAGHATSVSRCHS